MKKLYQLILLLLLLSSAAFSQPTLRTVTDPRFTTKGSELTWIELDDNFVYFHDLIDGLDGSGTSGITPYNAGTTYTGGETVYVSYNGNIYKFISATDETGVTPGTDGTVWELSSTGELVHQQGTDTVLNYGGLFQTSARDLYDLVNNQLIQVTAAQFETFRAAGSLKKNRWYQITDDITLQVYVYSMGGSAWSPRGMVKIQMPDASVAPTWQPTAIENPAINLYRSWSNIVYQHATGTNTSTSPDGDGTNWTPVITSAPQYKATYYAAHLRFDGTAFAIDVIQDPLTGGRYNLANGINSVINSAYSGWPSNDVDALGFLDCPNVRGSVNYNKLIASELSVTGYVSAAGSISENVFSQSEVTVTGNVTGSLTSNTFDRCRNGIDFPSGLSGTFANNYVSLTVNVDIDAAVNQSNRTITHQGSDADITLNITGASDIDLGTHPTLSFADIYGHVHLTSTNATETVDRLMNASTLFPIKITCESALNVTVNIESFTATTGDDVFVSDNTFFGGFVPLQFGDEITVVRANNGTHDVWKIINVSLVQ